MNNFGRQQNAIGSLCDQKRGLVYLLSQGHQASVSDSKYAMELLDILLKKEGHGTENTSIQAASAPSFFRGSPTTRAASPLIQDARFGDEKLTPMPELSNPSHASISSPTATYRKGGCVRMNFGLKPAAVRVEGFNCANMNHQDSRIPAMA